jgi:hypothetical protein
MFGAVMKSTTPEVQGVDAAQDLLSLHHSRTAKKNECAIPNLNDPGGQPGRDVVSPPGRWTASSRCST